MHALTHVGRGGSCNLHVDKYWEDVRCVSGPMTNYFHLVRRRSFQEGLKGLSERVEVVSAVAGASGPTG